ncbi:MAG TPA: hypothetical protein VGY77_04525 [Gemmataceae bacterium]|nr:hypothetical protein [Gemmataceae bacterium]
MKHYFELRSYDEARKVCLSCVEKWPDYWWSYLMLAKIESKLGDQSDGERRLAALAERWEDFFGYAFLAQFYFNRKEFEKSKQALQKALRPDPTRHKDQYAYEQIGSRESWVDDRDAAVPGRAALVQTSAARWRVSFRHSPQLPCVSALLSVQSVERHS